MNKYIDIPQHTTINEIIGKNYSLSATQYKTFCINNKNCKLLSELLSRDLRRSDLGSEVGSECYVDTSDYYFISKYVIIRICQQLYFSDTLFS